MLIASYILLSTSIIFALASGLANIKEKPILRIIFKSIASLIFVLIGVLNFNSKIAQFSSLVSAALICGMIGDIFLCMNDKLIKIDYKPLFLFGAIVFALGHVVYIVAYLLMAKAFNYYLLFIVLACPIIIFILAKIFKINAGKLNLFAPVYFAIIGLMVASTINLYILNKNTFTAIGLAAGLLFLASDFALMLKNFSVLKNNKFLIYFVLFTYYLAQTLFATMLIYH